MMSPRSTKRASATVPTKPSRRDHQRGLEVEARAEHDAQQHRAARARSRRACRARGCGPAPTVPRSSRQAASSRASDEGQRDVGQHCSGHAKISIRGGFVARLDLGDERVGILEVQCVDQQRAAVRRDRASQRSRRHRDDPGERRDRDGSVSASGTLDEAGPQRRLRPEDAPGNLDVRHDDVPQHDRGEPGDPPGSAGTRGHPEPADRAAIGSATASAAASSSWPGSSDWLSKQPRREQQHRLDAATAAASSCRPRCSMARSRRRHGRRSEHGADVVARRGELRCGRGRIALRRRGEQHQRDRAGGEERDRRELAWIEARHRGAGSPRPSRTCANPRAPAQPSRRGRPPASPPTASAPPGTRGRLRES